MQDCFNPELHKLRDVSEDFEAFFRYSRGGNPTERLTDIPTVDRNIELAMLMFAPESNCGLDMCRN